MPGNLQQRIGLSATATSFRPPRSGLKEKSLSLISRFLRNPRPNSCLLQLVLQPIRHSLGILWRTNFRALTLRLQPTGDRVAHPEERDGQVGFRSACLHTSLVKRLKSFIIVAAASDNGAWRDSKVVRPDICVERCRCGRGSRYDLRDFFRCGREIVAGVNDWRFAMSDDRSDPYSIKQQRIWRLTVIFGEHVGRHLGSHFARGTADNHGNRGRHCSCKYV